MRPGKFMVLLSALILSAAGFLPAPKTACASNAVTLSLFSPERFYRNTGGPDTVQRTFEVPALQGAITLSVDNGSSAENSLVSSAVVKINGSALVTASDLNQRVTHLERNLEGLLLKGKNTLEVQVRSIPSSFITISINGAYSMEIRVTDPYPLASIDSNKATVQGTWEAYTPDVGITVNGIPAALSGGVFVASNVPLVAGTNAVTATITTFDGIRDRYAMDIMATGRKPPVELWANLTSGVPPLSVDFSPLADSLDVAEYRYDLDGNGSPEIVSSNNGAVSFTYLNPGIFHPSLTIITTDGRTIQTSGTIIVERQEILDNLLSGRWRSTSTLLVVQDVEGALVNFLPESRGKYRDIFETIKDQLPTLYGSFPQPAFAKAENNEAQYFVLRNQIWNGAPRQISYFIHFQRDLNGIWRIKNY